MNLKIGPFGVLLLQAAALLLLLMPISIQAAEPASCQECHKKYIDEQMERSFVHQPFLAKKCGLCHTPDWVNDAAESDGEAVLPKKTKELGINDNLAQTHLFSIPKDYKPTVLFIEAKSSSSKSYSVKLKVPPFKDLEFLTSDVKPPRIYEVQVIEIERASMVSAKITWHTDELSTSIMNYGVNQPDGQSVQSSQYLTDHFVELYSLKPDVTYYFIIKAQDIYSNSRESRIFTFSTEKNYHLEKSEHPENKHEAIKLKSEILRSEDNYLVRISANQHVRMKISTYDLPHAALVQKKSPDLPLNHPLMKSAYESNVLLCEMCHQVLSEKFSHPVHFRARLGSNIPADYPRLPNGQMSCLTCHEYHASNYPNHMRKSAERELCIGCHKRSFRNR